METTARRANAASDSEIPFVSVVVPAYNSHRTIAACIESLIAQEYPKDRYEIIVVDNNSTDRTDTVVQNYPVELLYEREIQTPGAARNRGARASQGEIIAFTDSDCVASPNWLQALTPTLSDPHVGAVTGFTDAYQPKTLVELFFAAQNPLTKDDKGPFVPLVSCNMACRRDLIEDVGLFDSSLLVSEDIDLGWRIQAVADKRIVHRPEALVYHQYRSTTKELFHTYRRYGLSEIVEDTIFKGKALCPRTPRQQAVIMGRQIRALITYVLSFLQRCVTWPIRRYEKKEMLWPLLWLIAESGNLLGKLQGLVSTRFFRRNPYSLDSSEGRTQRKTLFQR